MVESLHTCSSMLHQLLGAFIASLQMRWIDLEQETRSGSSPLKRASTPKLQKLSSTQTAKSLCGIENHCKECLTSTLCCSFIAEDEDDHSRELHPVYSPSLSMTCAERSSRPWQN
ncbi:uncharacterized protein LOC119162318 isoform X2 [Rhipicephalus microplus]|uniref:uncharacterized protein LOC119162318 isoform X2 n=1 Tax=Rhipicephalus microplus TaxID=6941 RepID=UPI003F6AE149